MTLQTIAERIEAKRAKLARSQDAEVRFTLCGTRCRIWYATDTGLYYGYKRPLVYGYEPVSADALAAYVYRFQF